MSIIAPNAVPVTVYLAGVKHVAENGYSAVRGRSDHIDFKGFLLAMIPVRDGVVAIVHDREGFIRDIEPGLLRLGHQHAAPDQAN